MSLYPKHTQDEANKLFWEFVDVNYTLPEQYGLIRAAAPLFEGSIKHCAECFGVAGAHASWCTYKSRGPECPNCLRVTGHDRYCPHYIEGGVYDQDNEDDYPDNYGEDYA